MDGPKHGKPWGAGHFAGCDGSDPRLREYRVEQRGRFAPLPRTRSPPPRLNSTWRCGEVDSEISPSIVSTRPIPTTLDFGQTLGKVRKERLETLGRSVFLIDLPVEGHQLQRRGANIISPHSQQPAHVPLQCSPLNPTKRQCRRARWTSRGYVTTGMAGISGSYIFSRISTTGVTVQSDLTVTGSCGQLGQVRNPPYPKEDLVLVCRKPSSMSNDNAIIPVVNLLGASIRKAHR